MNQRLWGSLATTAFLLSTLGTATSSYAEQPSSEDDSSTLSVSLSETTTTRVASASSPTASVEARLTEVSKVGEYQSQEQESGTGDAIAVIQPHELNSRSAATLYVNNIPVLTFLGDAETAQAAPTAPSVQSLPEETDVKIASTQSDAEVFATVLSPQANPTHSAVETSADPVWRATAIAAQLNQMHQNRLDPTQVGVRWDTDRERYLIEVNDQELVEINSDTILPDTTGDHADDALQATNRLRRLMGGAPPLDTIEGRPAPQAAAQQLVSQATELIASGLASWYGPGFNGRRSASGEVFNQNALTAAHRSLPFGTQVRVTNLNNGDSVIVRINDRGPHVRGRVIDLSAGAASAIGLISAGVAPVSLEVIR